MAGVNFGADRHMAGDMIWSRNPIEIIAETLALAVPDTFEVAEDIIADLEAAGWHFQWAPVDVKEAA